MSNEEPAAGTAMGRRTPRQGVGGSPVGSTLSIVLAVVAVIAGFLILRNITDDSGGGSSDPIGDETGTGGDGDTTTDTGVTGTDLGIETTTTVVTTTTLAKVTDGATVIVANANSVGGSAGDMTRSLELEGYTMGTAVNATGPQLDDSIVYYDSSVAAAQDVAESVARDLGGVTVEPVPTPPPVESGSLDGAGVLVLLGNNQAGRTIEDLSGAAVETTTTVAAEAAPDPAASTTTTG